MGPDSKVQVAEPVVPSRLDPPGRTVTSSPGEVSSPLPPQRSSAGAPDNREAAEWSLDQRRGQNLRLTDWLYRSREMSFLWLFVRLWLGYQWVNAGYQKIWGSERAFFWFGGGAGVKGFASAGVAGSTAGAGSGASYGWWAAFLHNFVVPNASWIAKLVSLGEILIGVALILGLFTGAAALQGCC